MFCNRSTRPLFTYFGNLSFTVELWKGKTFFKNLRQHEAGNWSKNGPFVGEEFHYCTGVDLFSSPTRPNLFFWHICVVKTLVGRMWCMTFCLPVHLVWGDGAAAGSGAVGAVAGCAWREQGRSQEPPRGSRAPPRPVQRAGWREAVSPCGSPACQMTGENRDIRRYICKYSMSRKRANFI